MRRKKGEGWRLLENKDQCSLVPSKSVIVHAMLFYERRKETRVCFGLGDGL
jgi:hypothetical protein